MRLLLAIFILFPLISCNGPVECIDPENFGNQNEMTIDSHSSSPKSIPNTKDQYINWESKYRLTGEDIIMVVENTVSQTVDQLNCNNIFNSQNTWIPLYGDVQQLQNGYKNLSKFSSALANPKWCGNLLPMQDYSVPTINFPSRFYMGMGLYACASASAPENQGLFCTPEALIHVGDNACLDPLNSSCNTGFISQGCPAGGAKYSPKTCGSECSLYMKILDRYYTDNSGSYTVNFKKGVAKKELGAIAEFVSLVSTLMCKASKQAYNRIIAENDYLGYVRILLILYIIFTAISFLIGLLQITNQEFVFRILKIGLITQLVTSATSWSFFSEYFFTFFQNGVNQLTAIAFGSSGVVVDQSAVSQAASSGNIDAIVTGSAIQNKIGSCIPNVAGMQVFDDFINRIFSYETLRKISALMTWEAYGIIFVGVVMILIVIILISVLKSILVFIVSYLAISILIILAPIFIPFILFSITKSFFENWIKQLTSYFIQPLIILLFAFFVITVFNNEMDNLFGYRVCWKKWFTIPIVNQDIFAWQYDYSNSATKCILTPNAINSINKSGDVVPEKFPGKHSCAGAHSNIGETGNCDSYICAQNRYIGFPFLNPYLKDDQDRIKELKNHTLLSFKDLLVLIVLVWLLTRFTKVVPSIANQISGTSLSYTSASKVADSTQNGIGNLISKGGFAFANPIYKSITGRESLRNDYKAARKYIKYTTGNRTSISDVGNMIYKAPGLLPLKGLEGVGNIVKKGRGIAYDKAKSATSKAIDKVKEKLTKKSK